MDELIRTVCDKAGISAEQAKKAIEAVSEFAKSKFPAMGGQIDSVLKGEGGDAGDLLGKIGGMFGS